MDATREGAANNELIRRIIAGVIVLGVAGGITFRLSKLQAAAASVAFSTVWPDTVKRGPMLRDVRAFLPRKLAGPVVLKLLYSTNEPRFCRSATITGLADIRRVYCRNRPCGDTLWDVDCNCPSPA